jgi:hypothetical protein
MLGGRTGWWRLALLGGVVALSLQGCSQGAPAVNLGAWVRSPYVARLRATTTAAFGGWLSALRGTGLAPRVIAVADGCGQYVAGSGGGLDPVTGWGVTCDREVVVSLTAPGGPRGAQARIVRALTAVGWTHWRGTLAAPAGCRPDDPHSVDAQALIQPDVATASLSEWRLTCAQNAPGLIRFGPGASGCPTGPVGGWVARSWHEHECLPVGTLSRETAPDVILVALAAVYVAVDGSASNHTNPPAPS